MSTIPKIRDGKVHGDEAAAWALANTILKLGDIGVELDTKRHKYGDGVTPWASLPYASEYPAAAPTGRRRIRTAVFGSSTDANNLIAMPCTVTVATGGAGAVATVTSTDSPAAHLIGTGTQVFLGQPDPATSFEDQYAVGTFTRTSSTAGTVPVPGWTAGTGTFRMHIMSSFAPSSWFRELNSRLGGALELVVPFANAGETTARKILEFDRLLAFSPELIVGAWGLGNDVLQDDTANTVVRAAEMLDKATKRGIYCVVALPPATPGLSVAQATAGKRITVQLRRLYATNPLVLFIDETADTLNPMTGQGNAALFRDSVHGNYRYSALKGARLAAAMLPLLGQIEDRRVSSLFDSRAQDAASLQLMTGIWATSGGTTRPASEVETSAAGKVSGTINRSITKITTQGNGSRSAVFSLVARTDGVGFDQQVVYTAAAANDSLYIEFTNDVGAELWRYIEANQTYRAVFSLTITTGTATLAGYEFYLSLNVSGNNVRVTEFMRTTNAEVDTALPAAFTMDHQPAVFMPFSVPVAPTDGKFILQMLAATAGTYTVKLGTPTLRRDQ